MRVAGPLVAALRRLRRTLPACITGLLWAASVYFSYVSGKAQSAAVGTTIESQDYQALSSLIGLPAVAALGLLLMSRQTGGTALRAVKGAATFAAAFVLQVMVSFVTQQIASP